MKTYHAKKLFNFIGTANDELRSTLGEGPTWNANNVGGHRRTLSWVDIKKGKLFLYDTISNRVDVIFIVHLQEDQFHCAVNLGQEALQQPSSSATNNNGGSNNTLTANAALFGASSGSGSSATANGLMGTESLLVEGKPSIAGGEVETIGFAVPVADTGVFLCGSQHGLFYLRTNGIASKSVSSHDNKHAHEGYGAADATALGQRMDTTALQYSASAGAQSAATIRFYTYYITAEQYIYTLPTGVTNTIELGKRLAALSNATAGVSTSPADPVLAFSAPHSHRIRFNDAKTDRTGRLFLGTMDNEEREAVGDLYVLDPIDGPNHLHGVHCGHAASAGAVASSSPTTAMTSTSLRSLSSVLNNQPPTISNGIDWSPCNTRMFYIDSPTRRVDCFDYRPFATAEGDNKGGSNGSICPNDFSFVLANRRPFLDLRGAKIAGSSDNSTTTTPIEGYPDGLTVDAMGNIWVALWAGGRVIGIRPDTAEVFAEVIVPNVSNVTSVCFGGPALSWLIITTASKDGEPDSGHVFIADHVGGVMGIPASEFKGTAFSPPKLGIGAMGLTSAAPVTINHKKKSGDDSNEKLRKQQQKQVKRLAKKDAKDAKVSSCSSLLYRAKL